MTQVDAVIRFFLAGMRKTQNGKTTYEFSYLFGACSIDSFSIIDVTVHV